MTDIQIVHVGDLAESAGLQAVDSLLQGFSCPPNHEVESFLKSNALGFTKRSVSITHLVVSPVSRECLGYFTLTHKPFSVRARALSNSQRKRMERFAKYDPELDVYTVSAFLIAQIGRNFSASSRIYGSELIFAAFDRIAAAIHEVGGQVVFLECEEGVDKLRSFYERNGFTSCAHRYSVEDGVSYLQMFRFLK
jgi:predicted GNAT family N-acyltransferase